MLFYIEKNSATGLSHCHFGQKKSADKDGRLSLSTLLAKNHYVFMARS